MNKKQGLAMFLIMLFVISGAMGSEKQYYDTFEGNPITNEELRQHDKRNTTFWCAIEIKKCDPYEGRRLDGSCNNLEHPTRGATHTPFYRVLPAVYDKDFEPRKAKSGAPLPLPRYLRTTLLSEGRVPDQTFTQLATHFWVFMSSDVAALHDTVNYIAWKPYCCLPKGKTDNQCTPNKVPDDDPVHRFTDIRCLNMTRPISFQTSGCIPNNTTPERINTATPLLDLSTMYGSILNSSLEKGRLFKGGLLKFEEENGKIWPPSSRSPANVCFLNQRPSETRCHDTPDDGTNTVAGLNLFSIWFWRQHNQIATELSKLNPCWDDDKIFYTARDINIAIAVQIYYYELLPFLLGRDNLIRDNVISASSEAFRDFYNENIIPQMSLEYPFTLRWVHTMTEGKLKLYDPEGYYVKQFPIVNLTLRTGYLAVDNNLDYITQGSFRQPGAKIDYIVDPDIAEVGLGPHQRAADILTNDLAKNRYFGFPPYLKYREFCTGHSYRSFDDLAYIIDPERLEILKESYEHPEDIDLIAGMWVEKKIKGGFVPPTFYCLIVDQLIQSMVSDRHWYERPNRPNAFTYEQLQEMRKATISRMMCDVGDSVTRIQPNGFLRAGHGNQMCSCEKIPKIDLSVWTDSKCGTAYDKYPGDKYPYNFRLS